MRLLLHAYPRRWRERYGEELLALLEAEPLTWRNRANVLRSGLGERLRGSGPVQVRMLWAWALFVVGGMAFQKTSEHWQVVVPRGDRDVPTAAFDIVQAAAVVGSVAVLAGIALALPGFLRDLRAGGWPVVQRPVLIASTATVATVAALVALALRHDAIAASAFVATALLSLFAWTHAASIAARRVPLLRAHTYLARLVGATMLVMILAAAAWFGSVNAHAPSFVGAAQLAVAATFMLLGAGVGGTAVG